MELELDVDVEATGQAQAEEALEPNLVSVEDDTMCRIINWAIGRNAEVLVIRYKMHKMQHC